MTFFDPACGCGNFLIIAYREIRELEIEVLKAMHPEKQLDALAETLSVVDVDQFHGIEIGEFPVRIAETAMWMMDHIMNNRLSLEFGQTYTRIPLETSPHIVHGDALEMDWADLLPPGECSFVFGNPPFGGAKFQSKAQRAQVQRIACLGGTGGTLDYVTAWFIKAGEYANGSRTRIGFVATNSITRESRWRSYGRSSSTATGWRSPSPTGPSRGDLTRAERPMCMWSSSDSMAARLSARQEAPVQLSRHQRRPEETRHAVLSPYLFDAGGLADPHLTVREESAPVNGLPKLIIGSKPIDGGHYIFRTEQAREEFVVGGTGGGAVLAALHVAPANTCKAAAGGFSLCTMLRPTSWRGCPAVRDRIAAVRAYREASRSAPTRKLALLLRRCITSTSSPTAPFLVVPKVSSERREYVPIGWLAAPNDSERLGIRASGERHPHTLRAADLGHAHGLAAPHRRTAQERLPLRSIGLVYNTFPTPTRSGRQLSEDSIPWRKRSSTLAPPILTRRWRTSTTRI